MKQIILASGSPRRKELLSTLIGGNFTIQTSDYEEDNTLNLDPKDLVLRHSLEKAKDVAKDNKEAIVIGADTIIVFENKVLGKPHTEEKAKEMLSMMNGKTVEVTTGLAVIDGDDELQEFEVTKLQMKQMSEKEMDDYIATKEPLDKAGAFGIQGKGAVLVEKIDGCYFNVVGLPLFKLNSLLEKVGVSIFDFC